MANDRIRVSLFIHKMKQWELAKLLGIGENTLIRRLREELPEDEQNRIIKVIEDSAKGGQHDGK